WVELGVIRSENRRKPVFGFRLSGGKGILQRSHKVFATFGDKRTTRLFADLDALAEVMEKTISENKK
ncbi:TPA: hypothetical protein ACLAVK_002055, partial [Neisseria meningitidis]